MQRKNDELFLLFSSFISCNKKILFVNGEYNLRKLSLNIKLVLLWSCGEVAGCSILLNELEVRLLLKESCLRRNFKENIRFYYDLSPNLIFWLESF